MGFKSQDTLQRGGTRSSCIWGLARPSWCPLTLKMTPRTHESLPDVSLHSMKNSSVPPLTSSSKKSNLWVEENKLRILALCQVSRWIFTNISLPQSHSSLNNSPLSSHLQTARGCIPTCTTRHKRSCALPYLPESREPGWCSVNINEFILYLNVRGISWS